jgi:DNA-binding GntR family transcriptional regulator
MTLPSLVVEEVLRGIRAGELSGGCKLSETGLAVRLGVSRSPVREAFRALEEAGLVRLEKNRGVFVRALTEEEAAELREVRAGLVATAGRLLAVRITPAQLNELRCQAAQGGHGAGTSLYGRIVGMAGNATLLGLYRQVANRMHLLRRDGMPPAEGRATERAEAQALLAALATRDADAVANAVRLAATAPCRAQYWL